MQTCVQCNSSFPIDSADQKFYESMGVVAPTRCPRCRQQRRLSFRNEINLYKRKCDKTGKEIISMYSQDKPYVVFDQEAWWQDDWDATQYGRDYDFSRPFFEQFAELQQVVPRMSLNCIGNENSYYTNYALRNKNSYLVMTADFNEDCLYGRFSDRNFKCVDFDFVYDSRFCYESVDMHRCTNCAFSQKCDSSSDLYFCYDMRGSMNCIFSANQRNQNYLVFNKRVSQDEWKNTLVALRLGSYSGLQEALAKADEFLKTQPRKFLEAMQCEDCIGDYLKTSKNAIFCFDSYNLHDVKFGSHLFDAKDCYDWDFVAAGSERCYEMVSSAYKLNHCRFTMNSWDYNVDLWYCDLCLGNENLFGCVGMRKKEYCILNKQYKKEEYEAMVKRIIEHMKNTGEFGEFFPASLSPFSYNESVAFEYFPLSKEEVLTRGGMWRDPDPKEYEPQAYQTSDDIKDVPESITNETFACSDCGKNYRITPQEYRYYRERGFPIPRRCWLCRHVVRRAKRNPRHLYDRTCAQCGAGIKTTYAPQCQSSVYCEQCYLNAVS